MISIIIPTLNEEKYLPLLLDSIRKQDLKEEYELIVADAGSTDNTAVISKRYGCRITRGGLPAQGRNEGAKISRGGTLIFLDADVILPDKFLTKILNEFYGKKYGVASCQLLPIGTDWVPKIIPPPWFLYNIAYNWPASFLQEVFPYGSGLILVKKEIHEAIFGFNEDIKLSEDHDYVRRASKFGQFKFFKAKLPSFIRRYEKQGILTTNFKYLISNFFDAFGIKTKINRLDYKFETYVPESVNKKNERNFIFQLLWGGLCYLVILVTLIIWSIIYLLFTPKLIWQKGRKYIVV